MENRRKVSQKAIAASIAIIVLSFYLFSNVQGYIFNFSGNQVSKNDQVLPGERSGSTETTNSNKEEELERTSTDSNDTIVQTGDNSGQQQNNLPNGVQQKQPSKATPITNNKKYITSCSHWDSIIDKHSQNTSESTWAKRVMRCESGCRENAYNSSSGASGLFQIIVKWHTSMVGKVFNGEESIKYSLMKYRQGGAGLWVCK